MPSTTRFLAEYQRAAATGAALALASANAAASGSLALTAPATLALAASSPASSGSLALTTPAPLTAYNDEVLADTPLAYWKLDEAAGATQATDSSGNARHGTYNGTPTFQSTGLISGETEKCVTFNGTNAYVNVSAVATPLNTLTQFTVEMLIKPTQTTLVKRAAWGHQDSTGANKHICMWNETVVGQLRAWHGSVFANAEGFSTSGTTVFHVVFTRNGAVETLYVNGSQVAQQTAGTGAAPASTDLVAIGQEWDSGPVTSDFWLGDIEKVAVYSGVLSTSRITAHYSATQPPPAGPPVLAVSPATLNFTWTL